METRTNKYNEETTSMSRTSKNQNLYREINELQMDTFDVNSNSHVLSKDGKTIDIDRLKDMLDKRYREDAKKKTLGEIDDDEPREKIKLAETREYDINEILSKAKENKQSDYEVERLKKLRNTQVDILNQLNIDALNKIDDRVKAVSDDEKDELKTLIDTINLTEETNALKQGKDMDPLDLLGDLKGDDDTKIEGVSQLTEEVTKQAKLLDEKQSEDKKEEVKESKKEEKIKEDTKEITKTNKLDKSFYTDSTKFNTQDFDDFSDLKDEISSTKVVIRILIVLIIIAFICGVVFLLNGVLNWGLF